MNTIRGALCMLTGIWTVAGSAADGKQDVLERLQSCVTTQQDTARLQCYDAEMTRLARQGKADVAKPAVAPTAEEKFGFRGEIAREERYRQEAETPRLEQLTSAVAALSLRAYGELVVTLANGQVWAQKSVDSSFRLKVGDEVTIKPGTLGSFRLVSPTGRATAVARVR